jgi:hypothetical protein
VACSSLTSTSGPDQFQWTKKQLQLANELLRQIPEPYRVDTRNGKLRTKIKRPELYWMNTIDPSEAVCSSRIVPLVSRKFTVVERIDYGGTLLHLVLEGILGNFSSRVEDLAVLQSLFDAEQRHLRAGTLPSDFTYIVAQK